MQSIKKYIVPALLAATCGASAPAHAAAFASSILTVSGFRLLHSNGAAYSAGDFAILAGTNDAHATAQLDALFANGAQTRSITASAPNASQQCAGACPVAADNYLPIAGLPPVTGTYGHADQFMSGAAFDLNGNAAGATAATRADASAAIDAIAAGNSDVGTSTTFAFKLAAADTMTISFTGTPYTRALVTPGSAPIANANARLSWSLNIVNLNTGATVLSYTPDALNAASAVSATHGMPHDLVYAPGASAYFATTGLLSAGQTYQLTIQHNSLANAMQMTLPEPATLTVMGLGLLGMTLLRRRRHG